MYGRQNKRLELRRLWHRVRFDLGRFSASKQTRIGVQPAATLLVTVGLLGTKQGPSSETGLPF